MKKKGNKTKILVAGWIGSENTGDEAIFSSLLENLRKLNTDVTAFSVNEKSTKKDHKVKTAPFEIYNSPLRFLKAIKDTDIMIVGGGGILQDQTSIFNTPRYLYKALLALLFGKKVIFYAVGVGPINYRYTGAMIKYVLNKSNGTTVRDDSSKKVLISLGVAEHLVKVSIDPAISLKPISGVETEKILSKEIKNYKDKKIIGISVRHWFDINPFIPVSVMKKFNFMQAEGKNKYNNFVKTVAEAINQINKDNKYELLFIPYWYSRDSKVSEDIIKQLKNKNSAHILSRAYTSQEILGVFSKLDMAIAMRLHACIFSATCATPFIGLSYTSKVNNFLKEIKTPQLGVDIYNLKKDVLVKKINYVEKENKSIKESLLSFSKIAHKKEQLNKELLLKVVQSP